MLFKCRTVPSMGLSVTELRSRLAELGLNINLSGGRLSYLPNWKPQSFSYHLIYVRHGETRGNTLGVFQGNVDAELNQLNEQGERQKLAAAQLLLRKLEAQLNVASESQNMAVVVSPLTRAVQTAMAFVGAVRWTYDLALSVAVERLATEISFGDWENTSSENAGPLDRQQMHLYQACNALVKPPAGESFAELVLRQYQLLHMLEAQYAGKTVVLFAHGTTGGSIRVLRHDPTMLDEAGLVNWRDKNFLPHATPVNLF